MKQQIPYQSYQLKSTFGQTAVNIRPMKPGDTELLMDLHMRLSDESLYKRFLRLYRPTVRDIQFITNLSATQGAGVVATTTQNGRELAIGLAYYVVEEDSQVPSAEPAFVVDDWYQGQGLGKKLFSALCQTAVAHQIACFNVVVHPANGSMMRIFERSGLPMQQQLHYGERELCIQLPSPARQHFMNTAVTAHSIYQQQL
ncbi:GNAT family N-acetyltransferase [Candidatus Leptofilum sp.]|uniref:GNAT family N-acetyltransferase n=1 Tax=Candidatus Leptofilum sp. TaxID=3241576 RepID=UPI003B5CD9B2